MPTRLPLGGRLASLCLGDGVAAEGSIRMSHRTASSAEVYEHVWAHVKKRSERIRDPGKKIAAFGKEMVVGGRGGGRFTFHVSQLIEELSGFSV